MTAALGFLPELRTQAHIQQKKDAAANNMALAGSPNQCQAIATLFDTLSGDEARIQEDLKNAESMAAATGNLNQIKRREISKPPTEHGRAQSKLPLAIVAHHVAEALKRIKHTEHRRA